MFFFVKTKKKIQKKHAEERKILSEFEEEMLKIDIEKGNIKRELKKVKREKTEIRSLTALIHTHDALIKDRSKLIEEGKRAGQELESIVKGKIAGDNAKRKELCIKLENNIRECIELDKQLIALQKQIKEKGKKVKK